MRDEQIKELISAYLDDELSIDERSLVERHLADSVEHQQFLEQLRQQRMALRSIPRRKAKDDFSLRVLEAIERARPSIPAGAIPAGAATVGIRKAWQVLAAMGTIAALVMLALYFSRPAPTGIRPSPEEITPNIPNRPSDNLPDKVLPPERLPSEKVTEEPQSPETLSPETLVALGQFQELVQYIVIFDFTLSPKAQQDKILEQWMAKAGIPINKGVAIDANLQRQILGARFVGNDKVGVVRDGKPVKQDVEMYFVRGSIAQIDTVSKEYFEVRAEPNSQVQMRMDLVSAPRELLIFMQLNKAAGLDLAQMRENPRLLRTAGAFPIQFQQPLHSAAATHFDSDVTLTFASDTSNKTPPLRLASLTDAGDQLAIADSGLTVAQNTVAGQVQAAGQVKTEVAEPVNPANSSDQPGQAIFLVRKVKEEAN